MKQTAAQKIRKSKWQAANRDRISAKNAARYAANREAECAKRKAYREANLEAHKARNARWYANNKKHVKLANLNNYLKRTYGLELTEYQTMLEAQQHKCAICGDPAKRNRLAVDHCHITGKIRDLLCDPCNQHLGIFEKKRNLFEAYLRKHHG